LPVFWFFFSPLSPPKNNLLPAVYCAMQKSSYTGILSPPQNPGREAFRRRERWRTTEHGPRVKGPRISSPPSPNEKRSGGAAKRGLCSSPETASVWRPTRNLTARGCTATLGPMKPSPIRDLGDSRPTGPSGTLFVIARPMRASVVGRGFIIAVARSLQQQPQPQISALTEPAQLSAAYLPSALLTSIGNTTPCRTPETKQKRAGKQATIHSPAPFRCRQLFKPSGFQQSCNAGLWTNPLCARFSGSFLTF